VQWLLDRFDVDARRRLVHATHVDDRETLALANSGAIAGLCLPIEANLSDGLPEPVCVRRWRSSPARHAVICDSAVEY
jgi:cytosine/adenosine deaminase-related metal-dependent hydrolase